MTRTSVIFVGLLLTACSGADDALPDVPAGTIVVDIAGGDPFVPRPSPDGMRLAWSQPVAGQSAIFVANADGSDPVRITHGVWDWGPVWSPDGQWIAYQAEAPAFDVFIVSSSGGEPRQLTSGPDEDYPWYWLQDGSGVVFTREGSGAARTLVVSVDGGVAGPLVPAQTGNQFVMVSPDGTKAVIGLERGDGNTIWVQDLGGGEARQLTHEGLEIISRFPWSPDGRSVLFESRRTGTTDLWVADVQTGELRQLTTDVHNDDSGRWSPDGRWVLFASNRGGQSDLWIVSAEGGQPRRVTNDVAVETDHSWSPDGTAVYFVSSAVSVELEAVPLDGAPARRLLTWPGFQIVDADVSPDGRTVVFQSDRSGNPDLWSVSFEGGEPMPFAASPLEDNEPEFSPDGRTVAFVSDRSGSADIWSMPSSGGDATRLTDWPSTEANPRWSPDGSMIVFRSDRDSDRQELWITRADGGEARRLSTNMGRVADYRWSPDGNAIYFIGFTATGARDLYRVAVNGGTPEPLGAHPGIGAGDLSPDGSHYAYAVFDGGWAYIEVIPTAGGTPRRLATRTERIYQNDLAWTRDGSGLVVSEYDYPNDTFDVQFVSWPEGAWRSLTSTPDIAERPFVIALDGNVVVGASTTQAGIVRVPVGSLVGSSPE